MLGKLPEIVARVIVTLYNSGAIGSDANIPANVTHLRNLKRSQKSPQRMSLNPRVTDTREIITTIEKIEIMLKIKARTRRERRKNFLQR